MLSSIVLNWINLKDAAKLTCTLKLNLDANFLLSNQRDRPRGSVRKRTRGKNASRNAVNLAMRWEKTPPNTNNVNVSFFFFFFFTSLEKKIKKGKQTKKVNKNKLKEGKWKKKLLRGFSLRCYVVTRYAVTRFTNNPKIVLNLFVPMHVRTCLVFHVHGYRRDAVPSPLIPLPAVLQ